ncbi:MAG: flagellar assembly protein FlgT [Gammaproteobacteria bacterium]|nr:flagellar assembly protein FlgT [Gammaproteobacteria bacterium]
MGSRFERSNLAFVLLVTLIVTLSHSAQAARIVEATGSAVIMDGAVALARAKAIKDAARQAAIQVSAQVDSSSAVLSNVLVIDSTRVYATGEVEDISVLKEWQNDGVYFVRIRAQTPTKTSKPPSPAAGYRKKIAVLQFDVAYRNQIQDLTGIEHALSRELMYNLEADGHYLAVDGTDYLLTTSFSTVNTDAPLVISKIADKLGVQVVISGKIRDMGVDTGIFKDSRRAEIELIIYDGLSGSKLSTHRFSEYVDGAGYYKDIPTLFSLAKFKHTPYGAALTRIVNRQVEMIRTDLDKLPFAARILKADGNTVIFDAGNTSKVKVGDTLTAFRLEPEPLRSNNKRFLGYQEFPVANMVVKKVQPSFSVGELETMESTLYAGDLIRFGW